MRFGRAMREEWLLDPGVAYLNHGGFGATPRSVLAAQDAWRHRIEAQPTRFFMEEAEPALRAALATLARAVGAEPEDVVFTDNATTACNTVLASTALEPGDEVLSTSHGYAAVRNAIRYWCDRAGALPVEVEVPFPTPGPEAVIAAVVAGITERTRLLVVDHVTSPTGTVFPVQDIAAACRERGVAVLVDGAHAPGQLDLDIDAVGADYYVGNFHKWAFAPRGTALLHVRRSRQVALHPLVISHGFGHGFQAEHGWTGTRDVSGWLAAPEGLAFLEGLGGQAVRAYDADLCREAAAMLSAAWRVEVPVPASMRAALCTLPLPVDAPGTLAEARRMHHAIRDRGVEAPVVPFNGRLWVRFAAQVYNDLVDYERLREAVAGLA